MGRSVAAAVAAREACTNVRRVVRIRCSMPAAGKLPRKKCAGVTERHRQPRNSKLPIKTLDQICSRATSSIYDGQLTSLNQLQSPQTYVTILADDEVVVDGNAERGGDLDDRLGSIEQHLGSRLVAGQSVDFSKPHRVPQFLEPVQN